MGKNCRRNTESMGNNNGRIKMSENKRVAFLTEIISPYRIPVLNGIYKKLGGDFKVFFYSKMGKRRKWKVEFKRIKFNYEILPGICFQKYGASPQFFNPTLFYKLWKFNPDIVISGGYNHPASVIALLYSRLFGKRLILWCESNKYDNRSYSQWKDFYKEWFVKNCSEFVVPGKASFEYLILYGASPDKVWVAPNAVDNEFFSKKCDKARENIEGLKREKGYPENIILYVGRLVDEKGIIDLLKAYNSLTNTMKGIGLMFVGTGKDEIKYKDFCRRRNLQNVFFEGFIPQAQLPKYYAVSDVLVLPTHSGPVGVSFERSHGMQIASNLY